MNVEKILSIPFEKITGHGELTPQEKTLLINSYYEATGIKKELGCGQCLIEIYLYFRKNKTEIIKKIMGNSQFKLKENTVITNHKLNFVLTNANLTDEQAVQLLKISRSYIKCFEVYPENWSELLEGKKVKKEVEKTEPVTEVADLAAIAVERKKRNRV